MRNADVGKRASVQPWRRRRSMRGRQVGCGAVQVVVEAATLAVVAVVLWLASRPRRLCHADCCRQLLWRHRTVVRRHRMLQLLL